MRLIFSALSILRRPKYFFQTLLFSAFLFVLYFILNNLPVFVSIVRISLDPGLLWKVFINQVRMVWEIGGPLNVLVVGLVSIFASFNLALTLFRVRATGVLVGRPSALAFFGAFGGAFGAACSACNTSLIALLGVTGGLAIFPFKGLEISFLALIIILVSLYFVSKSLRQSGLID